MRNLIVFLTGLVAFNALADYGRIGASTAKAFGGGVESGSLEQQFINVINKEGSTIAAGSLVVWDITNDDGASVVIDTTRTANPACMIVKSCAANAFCKCQTYGYTDAFLFDAEVAASANSRIYVSGANAGYGTARAPLSSEQIGSIKPVGFFYDTPSTSGAVEVFLQLR
jgi:hypothetical protein